MVFVCKFLGPNMADWPLARPSFAQRSLIPRSPLAPPALAHPPLAPGWPRPCSSLTRPALARHSLGAGPGNKARCKRTCAQASMFTSGCVHIHAHVYTYREGGMRSFMKEMTLVIGPYMEQKTRPMEQIMHCKSCSLGHCEGSVDEATCVKR